MSNLLSNQERQELEYRLQLKLELDSRISKNRVKWFTPNGKQEEFINKIGDGDVFIAVFSAGNGVGKTALMVNILANIVLGEKTENPWFNKPLFDDFRFPHRGRIASTKKNVEEVGAIQTEIKHWFPKDSLKSHKMGKLYESQFEIGNWVWDIMTYDQKVEQYESATLGLMIFDEPPPMAILYACIARMRKGGIILIFMTPLDDGGQILEDLTEKGIVEYKGETLGKVVVVYADIEDNCKEHGCRGQLEHSHIAQMTKFYSEEEKEARQNGKPSHLTGRVYPNFIANDPQVVDDFEINDDYTIVHIIDPHDAIPFAMIWIAIDKTGQCWVYDESPETDLEKIKNTDNTYLTYGRIIREKEGRIRADHRIIDPFFGNKRFGNTGLTPKQELEELGFDFINGDTSGIDLGHNRVREFIKYDRLKPVSSLNHPKLHIMKRCRNTWRSMERYKRKIPKSGEQRNEAVLEETYKHFCDCIRHFVMKYNDVRDKPQGTINFDNQMSSGRYGV